MVRSRAAKARPDRRPRAACRILGSGSVETGSGIGPAGDRGYQRWSETSKGSRAHGRNGWRMVGNGCAAFRTRRWRKASKSAGRIDPSGSDRADGGETTRSTRAAWSSRVGAEEPPRGSHPLRRMTRTDRNGPGAAGKPDTMAGPMVKVRRKSLDERGIYARRR